jgi:hypothetical protein
VNALGSGTTCSRSDRVERDGTDSDRHDMNSVYCKVVVEDTYMYST